MRDSRAPRGDLTEVRAATHFSEVSAFWNEAGASSQLSAYLPSSMMPSHVLMAATAAALEGAAASAAAVAEPCEGWACKVARAATTRASTRARTGFGFR